MLDALAHARRLGARVQFIGFFANDAVGHVLERIVREDFPDAKAITRLSQTPTRVVPDGNWQAAPPTTILEELPRDSQDVAGGWPVNVVGPMSAADFPLVKHILSLSKCALLLLSGDQLDNRDESVSLMQSAGLTLLDYEQIELIAGQGADPVCAIRWLRSLNVGNVLLTLASGALGWIDSHWIWHPRFRASTVVRSAYCDHAFVGTLLAARLSGESWPDAIRLGLAASVIFTEGGRMPTGLDGLRALAEERPTVRFSAGPGVTPVVSNRLKPGTRLSMLAWGR